MSLYSMDHLIDKNWKPETLDEYMNRRFREVEEKLKQEAAQKQQRERQQPRR